MGEMADYYLEQELDYYYDYGWDEPPDDVECRRCGIGHLKVNINSNGNKQLANQDDTWHRCPASRVFDVVKV